MRPNFMEANVARGCLVLGLYPFPLFKVIQASTGMDSYSKFLTILLLSEPYGVPDGIASVLWM